MAIVFCIWQIRTCLKENSLIIKNKAMVSISSTHEISSRDITKTERETDTDC